MVEYVGGNSLEELAKEEKPWDGQAVTTDQ